MINQEKCTRSFFTVSKASKYIAEDIKKSRFIAQVAPVDNIDSALAFLEQIKDPKASHNCWAFKSFDYESSSDDGEPSGTAGKPILAAIASENVFNCMVVITRYFGGIKLGTGGLLRAYGSVAREALKNTEKMTTLKTAIVNIYVLLSDIGILYNYLQQIESLVLEKGIHNFQRINEDFIELKEETFLKNKINHDVSGESFAMVDGYVVKIKCPQDLISKLTQELKDACKGNALVEIVLL